MTRNFGKRRVVNSLLMMVAIMLLIPSMTFAQGGKTALVGYDGFYEYHDNALDLPLGNESRIKFSVTDVLDVVEAKDDYDKVMVISVNSPSKITVLADGGLDFGVYKTTEVTEDQYDINISNYYMHDEESLDVKGKMNAWVMDETGPLNEYGFSELPSVKKVIDISELSEVSVEIAYHMPGNTVDLVEPGFYYAIYREEAIAGAAHTIIKVLDNQNESNEVTEPVSVEPVAPADPVVTAEVNVSATPTNASVLVNGSQTSFNAYNINGNNYFKLRDLAYVVNSSEKQFQVEWNQDVKAINLLSDQAYTSVGGEMTSGDGVSKTGKQNNSAIYKDVQEVEINAYTIDDNNFFKLRDIAEIFDIGIDWDNESKTIKIDTTKGYIAE